MIRAKQLSKTYGSRRLRHEALKQVDFDIETGQRVSIVGHSGSGKTTLLNLLAGLDQPSSGELVVDGQELSKLNQRSMARFRLETVGVVFQSFQLIPHRTAFQNVELPLVIGGESVASRRPKVQSALAQVGLADRSTHYPSQLSGGEQQRVAIARAIVNRPPVLLADEPTGNLDTNTTSEIMELLVDVVSACEASLLLITHDLNLASEFTQRQLRMQDGQLAEVNA